MALSKTYTVFGFGPGLDWRPTDFVDGIASNRVCSACGLVPSATALLPCRHVLCRPCYESCVAEHNRCPLDKEPLEKDDVVWSTFSKDRLLKREIWCWNECYGCDAVGPASEILEHFGDDCEFHHVICPQCGFGIPKTDIVDHLESASCAKNQAFMKQKEYRGGAEKNISLVQQEIGKVRVEVSMLQTWLHKNIGETSNDGENAEKLSAPCVPSVNLQQFSNNTLVKNMHLCLATVTELDKSQAALQENVEVIESLVDDTKGVVSEVKESQVSTKESCRALVDVLKQQTRQINATKNSIKERLHVMETGMAEWIKTKPPSVENVAELKTKLASLEEISHRVLGFILHNPGNGFGIMDWTINDWSTSLETACQTDNKVIQPEEPNYFYGYSILPGIEVATLTSGKSIRCVFSIRKGDYDHLVSWPFRKTISFVIGYPAGSAKAEFACATAWGEEADKIKKPQDTHNEVVRIFREFSVSELEKDGCVRGNKVCIRVAVRA